MILLWSAEEDAVISDSLNHASIIDGVRLCKAKRFRYEHMKMGKGASLLRVIFIISHHLIRNTAPHIFDIKLSYFALD
tara:strand:+ start:154 stop:387 length:234 start_codon:yes stop_codon:yes gene_type:complete